MHESLQRIVVIETADNEEKMRIGTSIHEQLRGNQDYIDSNIVLNVDDDCTIRLWILKACKEVPKITF